MLSGVESVFSRDTYLLAKINFHSNMLPTPEEIRQRYGSARPQSAKPQLRRALPPLPETISEQDARRLLRQASSLEGGQLDRVIRQATVGEDVVSVDRLKE